MDSEGYTELPLYLGCPVLSHLKRGRLPTWGKGIHHV